MLKIAVVESEEIAKEIIFDLHNVLEVKYQFTYYKQITKLIKDTTLYDLVILNIQYNSERIHRALDYKYSHCVYMYLCEEGYKKYDNQNGQYFYVETKYLKKQLQFVAKALNQRLSQHYEYLLSYDGIQIKLKYHDIYYMEKEDKNVVYYTKNGVFVERVSIAKIADVFYPFGFILISSGILVNYEYILKIDGYILELHDHTKFKIARARRPILAKFMQEKVQQIQ